MAFGHPAAPAAPNSFESLFAQPSQPVVLAPSSILEPEPAPISFSTLSPDPVQPPSAPAQASPPDSFHPQSSTPQPVKSPFIASLAEELSKSDDSSTSVQSSKKRSTKAPAGPLSASKAFASAFAPSLKLQHIPSGSISIDFSTNGGWPRGHIIEIAAQEGTGKSTLAIEMCKAGLLSLHQHALYADFENRITREFVRGFGFYTSESPYYDASHPTATFPSPSVSEDGSIIPGDPIPPFPTVFFYQATTFESGEAVMLAVLKEFKLFAIVVDSVPNMIPELTLSLPTGDQRQKGLSGQYLSTFCNKFSKLTTMHNFSLFLINQLRTILTIPTGGISFGPPMGYAHDAGQFNGGLRSKSASDGVIRYAASMRVFLRKTQVETEEGFLDTFSGAEVRRETGAKVILTFDKQTIDALPTAFYIKFGHGIDNARSVYEAALSTNHIQQKGAFFYSPIAPDTSFLSTQEQSFVKVSDDPSTHSKCRLQGTDLSRKIFTHPSNWPSLYQSLTDSGLLTRPNT